MIDWIEKEHGNVKMKHYSTSSLIEIIITTEEEVGQGEFMKVEESVWVDYNTFSDLQKVIKEENELNRIIK